MFFCGLWIGLLLIEENLRAELLTVKYCLEINHSNVRFLSLCSENGWMNSLTSFRNYRFMAKLHLKKKKTGELKVFGYVIKNYFFWIEHPKILRFHQKLSVKEQKLKLKVCEEFKLNYFFILLNNDFVKAQQNTVISPSSQVFFWEIS